MGRFPALLLILTLLLTPADPARALRQTGLEESPGEREKLADALTAGLEEVEVKTTGPWTAEELVDEMAIRIQSAVKSHGGVAVRVGLAGSSDFEEFPVSADEVAQDRTEEQVRSVFARMTLVTDRGGRKFERFLTWNLYAPEGAGPTLSFGLSEIADPKEAPWEFDPGAAIDRAFTETARGMGIDPDPEEVPGRAEPWGWVNHPGFYPFFPPEGETVGQYLDRLGVVYGRRTSQRGLDRFVLSFSPYEVTYTRGDEDAFSPDREQMDELTEELRGRRILDRPAHHWILPQVSLAVSGSDVLKILLGVEDISKTQEQPIALAAFPGGRERFDALVKAIFDGTGFDPIQQGMELLRPLSVGSGSLEKIVWVDSDPLRVVRSSSGDGSEWLVLTLAPGLWDEEVVFQRFGIFNKKGGALNQAAFRLTDLPGSDGVPAPDENEGVTLEGTIQPNGKFSLTLKGDSADQVVRQLPAFLGVAAVVSTDALNNTNTGLEEDPGEEEPWRTIKLLADGLHNARILLDEAGRTAGVDFSEINEHSLGYLINTQFNPPIKLIDIDGVVGVTMAGPLLPQKFPKGCVLLCSIPRGAYLERQAFDFLEQATYTRWEERDSQTGRPLVPEPIADEMRETFGHERRAESSGPSRFVAISNLNPETPARDRLKVSFVRPEDTGTLSVMAFYTDRLNLALELQAFLALTGHLLRDRIELPDSAGGQGPATGLEEIGLSSAVAASRRVVLTPATADALGGLSWLGQGGEPLQVAVIAADDAQEARVRAGLEEMGAALALKGILNLSRTEQSLAEAVASLQMEAWVEAVEIFVVDTFEQLRGLGRFLDIPDVSFRSWLEWTERSLGQAA